MPETKGHINAKSLRKAFGQAIAVDGVDFTIEAGSYCCLLGPSGCGKTTTLRMISGHDTQTAGTIAIDGTDLGASFVQVQRMVVIPMIAPSLIGIALFGFTLSFDEFARTLLAGGVKNTLPLEIFGMTTTVTTPTLYALGTVTTVVSFTVILVSLAVIAILNRRALAKGSVGQ